MKKVLIALLILFAAGLLAWWSIPAETAWTRLAAKVPNVRLQGVTGRVWSGQAQGVSIKALPMGSATWSLSPWQALTGQAAGTLQLIGGPITVSTELSANQQDARLTGLKASIPAQMLEPALDIPALRLLGTLDLAADEVLISGGMLKSAKGVLQWNDLGVSGLAEAKLGGLRMSFAPEGQDIVGKVTDLGGALAVDGSIRIQGQTFHAEVNLDARDDSVREALLYVGERKPNGGSLLVVDGVIEKLY